MKNTLLILLAFTFVFSSCKKDDETPEEVNDSQFSYDGSAQDAPALEAGVYDLGARFPSALTDNYEGKQLEEVSFYILSVPNKCELLVFGQGSDTEPGSLLYSANLTSSIDGETWNKHTLSTPVDITGEDLWICVRVEHGATMGSLGCDIGPANLNGDWMYADNVWTSLRNYTGGDVNINWNIRGKVSE